MADKCDKCGMMKNCGYIGCKDRPGHVHCMCGYIMSAEAAERHKKKKQEWGFG